jgi:hypothetical protein
MLPRGIKDPRPNLENEHDRMSLDIRICSFFKAARLVRLRAATPSTRTWYNLTLAMAGETSSGSYLTPTMFLW